MPTIRRAPARALLAVTLVALAAAARADDLSPGEFAGPINFDGHIQRGKLVIESVDGNKVKGTLIVIAPKKDYPCTSGEHAVSGTFAANKLTLGQAPADRVKGCNTYMKLELDGDRLTGSYNGQYTIDFKR